jgi:hypothetical protein
MASIASNPGTRGSLGADEAEFACQPVLFLKQLHQLAPPTRLQRIEVLAIVRRGIFGRKPTIAVVESPKGMIFTCAKIRGKKRAKRNQVVAAAILLIFSSQRDVIQSFFRSS